jgi:hypothetical protein
MIKDLLSSLVLVGVVLAAGALGGSSLLRELGKEAECPKVVAATSRDADAQIFGEEASLAITAVRELRDDVQLYRVTPGQAGGTFYFLSQHDPPPNGPLLAVALPRVGNPRAYEIQANVFKEFEFQGRMIQALDDLILGPSRARSIVQAQYPSADLQFAVLSRAENCELGWRVAGTINEDGKDSLKLKARVDNATGELSLPEGPPAPYHNLLDIIMPWN